MGTKWWRTIVVIALKGNFNLLLYLACVGMSIDSIESRIHPMGFSKGCLSGTRV